MNNHCAKNAKWHWAKGLVSFSLFWYFIILFVFDTKQVRFRTKLELNYLLFYRTILIIYRRNNKIEILSMKNLWKIFFSVLILLLVSACSSSKSFQRSRSKKNVIHVETTHLGKNKYYFSKGYQKKLNKRATKNRKKNKRR